MAVEPGYKANDILQIIDVGLRATLGAVALVGELPSMEFACITVFAWS
jgi:hypothetical protein